MKLLDTVHSSYVFNRRIRILASHLAPLLPHGARVLDVGCGDGSLAALLLRERPDLELHGIDVLIRPTTHLPVLPFDGEQIPHPDQSFDAVLFVDVLHHTNDPLILLREAARVTRQAIVLKDHTANGFLARPTLRFMDHVGNARHGVVLPYNYWSKAQWEQAFRDLGLRVVSWQKDLGLYPWPTSWLFGRSLHFIARLEPENPVHA